MRTKLCFLFKDMRGQNVFWTAGVFVAALLQTAAAVVSVEDDTAKGQTSTLLLGK